jgi:hypothetical protein
MKAKRTASSIRQRMSPLLRFWLAFVQRRRLLLSFAERFRAIPTALGRDGRQIGERLGTEEK